MNSQPPRSRRFRTAYIVAAVTAVYLVVLVVAVREALVRQAGEKPPIFHVRLDHPASGPVSGRLLLFVTPAKPALAAAKGHAVGEVDTDAWHPDKAAVAAREVFRLTPGATVEIDTDALAFPTGFSKLPPGEYLAQAVLDQDHNYNYSGRDTGDLVSGIIPVTLPTLKPPVLTLNEVKADRQPWKLAWETPEVQADAGPARKDAVRIEEPSAALTAFWGRPTTLRGWVLVPPGYREQGDTRYPTVYFTHGYGGDEDSLVDDLVNVHLAMQRGEMPPMIWVFLDQSTPTGTHEFADSVNNGPWGEALTRELIPWLETRYRMDAREAGRFLTGHSSGGWATLWLQTHYADLFGGTWSTSPDPVDFHDFSGVDLYAPKANMYRRPNGTPWPIDRVRFKAEGTFANAARLEAVLGPYGGQLSSYEWVFSPRGPSGSPMPLFDRATGDVDPAVRDYWVAHYDISRYVTTHWNTLKPHLDGKIHITVGTDDTWYLDGAVHRFKVALDGLGARSEIRFLPGKAHMDLYARNGDPHALLKEMAWEMYAVARPDAPRPVVQR
ncbi:alpha/beta hydrolase [Luteibacter aegosomatissinici]|uniref:alpha/beta hydrolase n=1 Tax=Luteibacter aegosomatissinici TaxID=2911539 RepID=UPI001FF9E602|nr:alpha/beta hydrolase-fold protein [Luteibacter aegosomatissinici]UPG95164.1 esterase family protein [Luteibacter aegosomatissinici]